MAIDPLLILLIALVAIVVAATAARRSADARATASPDARPVPPVAARSAPSSTSWIESVALYGIRQRLGLVDAETGSSGGPTKRAPR